MKISRFHDPLFRGKTYKLVFRLSNNDALASPSASTALLVDIYLLKNSLDVGYRWGNRVPHGASVGLLTAKKGKWDEEVGVLLNGIRLT